MQHYLLKCLRLQKTLQTILYMAAESTKVKTAEKV